MTAFSFNNTIPATANNPSNDQPIMLLNNVGDIGIWAVDHVGYNSVGSGGAGSSGGQHLQVTYNLKQTPAIPVDPLSIGFAQSGQDGSLPQSIGSASPIAQNFYVNQNGYFPLAAIKAFGVFIPGLADSNILNGFNINAVVTYLNSPLSWTVTLSSSTIVNSNNVAVFVNQNTNAGAPRYTFTNPNLVITGVAINTSISFLILQI